MIARKHEETFWGNRNGPYLGGGGYLGKSMS